MFMKAAIFLRTVAGDGRFGQLRERTHSTSITGGMAPAVRGTLRMNHLACASPELHQ